MKIIGLTGGIGSGKSTVARFFEQEGIAVYYADQAGRKVLEQPEIIKQVEAAFGSLVLVEGKVDRQLLASLVFNNPEKLGKLNAIIHPAVRLDFENWKTFHGSEKFVIREAAILFESGTYLDCDKIILVTAPVETRISRVMARDGVSREQVEARMAHQWDDARKQALSDYIVSNTDLEETRRQCAKILKKLKNL